MDLETNPKIPYLRLLFWLKFKLIYRAMGRNSTAVIGMCFSLIIFLPVSIGLAWLLYIVADYLPAPGPDQVLRAAMLGIYIFWIMAPIIGFALNNSFDIGRLLLYPITMRQLLAGSILGSLLDVPILLLLPTMIVIVLAFTHSLLSAILIVTAIALWLFHTLCISQSIVIMASGVLRNRRIRDILVIVAPAFGGLYYIVQELVHRGSFDLDWQGILASPWWELVNILPPGMAAKSISAASSENTGECLLWLLGLFTWSAMGVTIAAKFVQKVFEGEAVASRAPRVESTSIPTTKEQPRLQVSDDSRLDRVFGPAVGAVLQKEARYGMRDPYFKSGIVSLIYMLVVVFFMSVPRKGMNAVALSGELQIWVATGMLLLSEMRFLFNLLGTEGKSIQTLFMFPVRRRDILIGKNIFYGVTFICLNTIVAVTMAIISHATESIWKIVIWTSLSVMVFAAAGNPISALFPMRVINHGRRVKSGNTGQGCAFGMLYTVSSFGAFIFLAPILAAVTLPGWLINISWQWLLIPMAILYSFGIYCASLHLAESILLDNELRILGKLGMDET